ncbi:MAG: helix-turn-helix transcriptional regulator [Clostridia bacterium]|nr:helix-turn-helix transcriptional regulator [Clostridia bacterium]
MKFYKITLNSIPEILFAHQYSTNNYNIVLHKLHNSNCAEFTYVEQGTLVFEKANRDKRIYQEKTVNCNIYNETLNGMPCNTTHTHITVGISGLSDIEIIEDCDIINFSEKENIVIVSESLPLEESAECKNLIKDIIYNFTAKNNLKVTSILFELFSYLNDYSLKYVGAELGISHSDYLYCQKIKNYISENIYKKIALKDIANFLNLSESYICRIFKKANNCSIINYINKTKINLATDILLSKTINTSELSSQLGIDDEKYFCRLFKKHTGKTVTEYKKGLSH